MDNLFVGNVIPPPSSGTSPFFESDLARLQHAVDDRFNLAYFRHTGQWGEVAELLSLKECLSEIDAGGLLTP